jgi:fatty acid desaturase
MEKARALARHPLMGKALTVSAAISAILLIPAGFFGFFTLTLNLLYFIVCLYIVYVHETHHQLTPPLSDA